MSPDPYKYFRIESRELVESLARGALDLERGGGAETVASLLRAAHTLKGAARVVRLGDVADLAHAIEEVLAPHRDEPGPVPAERVEALLTLVDAVTAGIQAVDPTPAAGGPEPAGTEPAGARADTRVGHQAGWDAFETVRVELADMDAVLEGLAETAVQVGALRGAVGAIAAAARDAAALVERLERRTPLHGADVDALAPIRASTAELHASLEAAHRRLAVARERAERELAAVRDRAERVRLIPVGAVFDSLERAVRDAANALGRTIDFVAEGGAVRLDQHVLAGLRDGLLHVVRNAVAHGIEAPDERSAAGKPPAGRVELRFERRRGRVAVTCSDDGRGIDVEAVQRAAADRGLVARGEALDGDAAVRLLLRGGISTAASVSQVSGRGVGLQVLRSVAERFKGELVVRSEPGRGTTIAIDVPVSLASVPAIVAEVSDVVAAIPRDAVAATVRLPLDGITRGAHGDSILFEGRAVPFAPLAALLGLASAPRKAGSAWNVVLVQSGGSTAAVGVDRIQGLHPLLVRPLPAAAGSITVVAGASLDAEGNPWLVLDPAGLVAAVREARGSAVVSEPAVRPAVLVIDDSLTTRMLERAILETAGYEVDIATSGEEGLAKAAQRRYGVFVVDVEMPGIDGFEFVRRTRADPALRDTPAILVTSLGSPEHKRRGMEVGARGYIVKGEFDELQLLGTIRGLIG